MQHPDYICVVAQGRIAEGELKEAPKLLVIKLCNKCMQSGCEGRRIQPRICGDGEGENVSGLL